MSAELILADQATPIAELLAQMDRDARGIAKYRARLERDPETGCLLWHGRKDRGGYATCVIRGKLIRIARFVLEARLGRPLRPGMQPLHDCDVRNCIEPRHLHEGTAFRNNQEMLARGRDNYIRGVAVHTAKLNDEKVRVIRTSQRSAPDLAREFGVTERTIRKALSRETWAHVYP